MTPELGPAAVAAAGLAGIAAALAVSPARAQRRVALAVDSGVGCLRVPGWSRVARLLVGRPDALSLTRRCAVAATAASAIALGLWRVTPNLTLVTVSIPLSVLAVVIGLGWMEPAESRRRRRRLVIEAPQALDLLASCLVAGLPLRAATAEVAGVYPGPLAEELGSVLRMINLGVPETDAWRTLRGHPELGAAAIDLARSAESGTMLLDALNHHARAARQRRQAAWQVAARAVGVRSVLPLMTCFLPAFLLLGVVPSVVSAIANALS
jgi:pilus assembly protein TadC